MFLPKLLIAGVVCVGCGIPVAFELLRDGGTNLEGLVFKKEKEATQPILTCKGTKSNIELSLAYKKGTDGKEREIYWKGFDRSTGQDVNLEDKIRGTHHRGDTASQGGEHLWTLTVFKNTGGIRLNQANETNLTDHDPETITCEKGKFEVTKPTKNMGRDWEGPVVSVKLTLNNCEDGNGKQVCEIKISDDVGLKWKEGFKPKAIF